MSRARRILASFLALCVLGEAPAAGAPSAAAAPRDPPFPPGGGNIDTGSAGPGGSGEAVPGPTSSENAIGEDRVRSFPRARETRRWAVAGAAAALAGGVALAVLLKAEADDRFALYRETADPAAARRYYDAAVRRDRWSVAGWVVAEVSFVVLFRLLTRGEDRPLVPTRGEPVLRSNGSRVEVGWRVAP